MANLLPEEKRKQIERERWVHMITIGVIFFLVTTVLALVALIPSLFLSRSKGEDTQREVGLIQAFVKLQEESGTAQTVRDTQIRLLLLGEELEELSLIGVVENLVDSVNSRVGIDAIRFSRTSNQEGSLILEGFALTREDLLAFAKELENVPLFTDVNLPVSNLARGSDIDFIITVTVLK